MYFKFAVIFSIFMTGCTGDSFEYQNQFKSNYLNNPFWYHSISSDLFRLNLTAELEKSNECKLLELLNSADYLLSQYHPDTHVRPLKSSNIVIRSWAGIRNFIEGKYSWEEAQGKEWNEVSYIRNQIIDGILIYDYGRDKIPEYEYILFEKSLPSFRTIADIKSTINFHRDWAKSTLKYKLIYDQNYCN